MTTVEEAHWTPQRIRALRERLGLTQREAAELVGVNDSMWCHWEKGRHPPTRPFEILLGLLDKGVLAKGS
jgi:DNA-binding transcriptional regulator YiaG